MDLDDAYANSAYIPDGERYFARWANDAVAFRALQSGAQIGVPYGPAPRQTFDVFQPNVTPKGTVVIVHGGYWMACSPQDFSHLAKGAIDAGYRCAMPSYTLAPDARISEITAEIASAIAEIAAHTQGPLYLTGHSAGGHLVARMMCDDISADWQSRIAHVVPISPLGDLAPLMRTSMNNTLHIDAAEARSESPIHHQPLDIPVTVWVGGAERPAFLQQAKDLAGAWGVGHVIDPDRHHFDVIEGLQDADSLMMKTLLQTC